LENYLFQELQRISEVLTPVADGAMEKRHVVPEKPRFGLFYADGSDWDPGSGEGIYRYDEDTASFVALEGGAGTAGFSGLGTWRHRTETATPPGSGQIRFDNADPLLATEIFVHETNVGSSDMGNFLGLLTSGSLLFLQDKSNAANFFVIEISSNTDSGVYRTFGINNIVLQGTEPTQNQAMLLIVSESGSGAAPVASVFGRTGAVTALVGDYSSFYAALSHNHAAGDITTGILAVLRGGTGVAVSTGSGSNVLSATPALTGNPTAPTQTPGNDSTRLATTAFVQAAGGGAAPQLIIKAADESIVSSTTMQDDNHFVGLNLVADKWYRFEGIWMVTGSSTADMDFEWAFTNTPQSPSVGGIHGFINILTAISSARSNTWSFGDFGVQLQLTAGTNQVLVWGHFQANATTGGTMKLRWAQATSNATPTVLLKSSYIILHQLD
jgi:hypothetical protein